jgi:hypothetical protein
LEIGEAESISVMYSVAARIHTAVSRAEIAFIASIASNVVLDLKYAY